MRKILAIGLILILFFTCAAVSAEEAISDDIVSVDETIDEAAAIEEDSIIEQSIELFDVPWNQIILLILL